MTADNRSSSLHQKSGHPAEIACGSKLRIWGQEFESACSAQTANSFQPWGRPWADFGRANSLHLGSATPFAANPTAREMTRRTGSSAPARHRSWNGACCPIGPYRHPGVADQNLGLRARTSFWSPLQDSHSSQRHRRPAGPSGEGSQVTVEEGPHGPRFVGFR